MNPLHAPAYAMLRPTLEHEDAFHCILLDDHIAVLVLSQHSSLDETTIAVRVHAALDRGLLVVAR